MVRQQERCNERRCRLALAAWVGFVANEQALRQSLCAAVDRLAVLKLQAAFSAWAQHAEDKRLKRQRAESILQKVLHTHGRSCLIWKELCCNLALVLSRESCIRMLLPCRSMWCQWSLLSCRSRQG